MTVIQRLRLPVTEYGNDPNDNRHDPTYLDRAEVIGEWHTEAEASKPNHVSPASPKGDEYLPDHVEIVGGRQERIPPGQYQARCISKKPQTYYGKPKLALEFAITDGPYSGTIIRCWRTVSGIDPRIQLKSGSKLAREIATVCRQRGKGFRADRPTLSSLDDVELSIAVRDTEKDALGNPHPEPYSRVESIQGVYTASNRRSPKDPTAAERKRRQREKERQRQPRKRLTDTVTERDIYRDTVTPP